MFCVCQGFLEKQDHYVTGAIIRLTYIMWTGQSNNGWRCAGETENPEAAQFTGWSLNSFSLALKA